MIQPICLKVSLSHPWYPWDWYIYLHEWLIFYGFHVGKYIRIPIPGMLWARIASFMSRSHLVVTFRDFFAEKVQMDSSPINHHEKVVATHIFFIFTLTLREMTQFQASTKPTIFRRILFVEIFVHPASFPCKSMAPFP